MTPQQDRPLAIISWSGGKDSCLAFLRARDRFTFVSALTMLNEDGTRSRAHGLRPDVLRAQVDALGLEWMSSRCSWSSYQDAFVGALRDAAARGVTHLVCGDIVYPAHKHWVESVCVDAGLHAVEPLWGEPTIDVCRDFLNRGGVARIVAVQADKLRSEWLYRRLDEDALSELRRLGVDACGENGEYHTLVTSCPAFSRPLTVEPGAHVLQSGYWAVDVHAKHE
jgi:uncharacterized protein (TIGR00290 family)